MQSFCKGIGKRTLSGLCPLFAIFAVLTLAAGGAAVNFGSANFTLAGTPAGAITPLAGTTQKSVGAWERLWLTGRESEGVSDTTLTRPMEQSAWVLAAIDLIIQQITPLKLEWFASAEESDPLPADTERARWWACPARTHAGAVSLGDTIEIAGAWLKLKGCVHFILTDEWLTARRGAQRPPLYIGRPDRMMPIQDGGQGELIGWRWSNCGRQELLIPEQVITLRKANPFDEINGLSAYRAASVAAEADVAGGRFARNVASSNGSSGEYIVTDGPAPTPEQQEQIIAALREKKRKVRQGDFAPTFLAGGLKVEDPKMKSVDAAFVVQRVQNRHEIFAAFGVPMSFADVKAAYSLGADSDTRQLVWGASMPLAAKLTQAFAQVEALRTGSGPDGRKTLHAAFNWRGHPVMQAVMMGKLEAVTKLAERGVPMKEINELLDLGLPRFLGDDVGFMSYSTVPVTDVLQGDSVMIKDNATPNTEGAEAAEAPPVEAELVQQGFQKLADALQARRALRISQATIKQEGQTPGAGEGRASQPAALVAPPAAAGAGAAQLSKAGADRSPHAPRVDDVTRSVTTTLQLGARSRHNLWQSHQNKRAPKEKAMQSAVRKVYGRYRAQALDALAKWGAQVGYEGSTLGAALPVKSLPAAAAAVTKAGGFQFLISLPDLQRDLKRQTQPVLKGTLEKAGEECQREVLSDDPFTMAPEAVKRFLNVRENRISGAAEQTFTNLTESLSAGYDNGETMAQLQQRVKDTFGIASDSQAKTIAQTETAACYSVARAASMEQAGITHKEWLTAKDDRVRSEHAEMDGIIVPMDEPFVLSDGTRLMNPADESGPAHHVINCRCVSIAAVKGGEEV